METRTHFPAACGLCGPAFCCDCWYPERLDEASDAVKGLGALMLPLARFLRFVVAGDSADCVAITDGSATGARNELRTEFRVESRTDPRNESLAE